MTMTFINQDILTNYYNKVCLLVVTMTLSFLSATPSQAAPFNFSDDLLSRVSAKYGSDATKRLNALGNLVNNNMSSGELEKVEIVNDFFNQIPYYTDIRHWKVNDYWATPIEKLSTYGGDCEDYAISKFFTLRELGVEEKKLRIMYVKAIKWNEAHMVLAYYPKPSTPPFVLDHIDPKLKTADKRKDLIPVYSFNAKGLYLAKAQGTGKRVGGPEKLKLWTSMMKRMDGSDI